MLVGAFPGAIPCLIGWVAATNEISPLAEFIVDGKNLEEHKICQNCGSGTPQIK